MGNNQNPKSIYILNILYLSLGARTSMTHVTTVSVVKKEQTHYYGRSRG